jgi:hypothetical protein
MWTKSEAKITAEDPAKITDKRLVHFALIMTPILAAT